jgi:hypothetical protein
MRSQMPSDRLWFLASQTRKSRDDPKLIVFIRGSRAFQTVVERFTVRGAQQLE